MHYVMKDQDDQPVDGSY